MARKRTHEEAPRTKMVSVRLREETFTRITTAATNAGLSRAGYIEHIIENRPVKVEAGASDALPVTLINELKRVGNNLNQIAHNANAGITPTDGVLAKAVAEVFRVLSETEITQRRLAQAVNSAMASLAPDERAALEDMTRVSVDQPIEEQAVLVDALNTIDASLKESFRRLDEIDEASRREVSPSDPDTVASPSSVATEDHIQVPATAAAVAVLEPVTEPQPATTTTLRVKGPVRVSYIGPSGDSAGGTSTQPIPSGGGDAMEIESPDPNWRFERLPRFRWVPPPGVGLKVTWVKGGLLVTDPSPLPVRIARAIKHWLKPPPVSEFHEKWLCYDEGTLRITQTPRSLVTPEEVAHDRKASPAWPKFSGRLLLRTA